MSAGTSASSAAAVVVVVRADQKGLPHVRDVEQPGLLARVQMLLEDAERILHRHLVAGERHHLGAERHVQLIERRALQGGVRIGRGAHRVSSPIGLASRAGRHELKPPLSRDLRDFGETLSRLTPSVSRRRAGCFPERHQSAVLLPERFRGGCSFGAGHSTDQPSLPQISIGGADDTCRLRSQRTCDCAGQVFRSRVRVLRNRSSRKR